MSLVEKIDAIMRAAEKPLSARHVAAMMPTGTNIDTVGTLLSQRRRRGFLSTVVIDGITCYERRRVLQDEPLERGRPGPKPKGQRAPAYVGPKAPPPPEALPVMLEFVRAGEVIAAGALNTLLAARGPKLLVDMVGDAARDFSQARYQMTLTVELPPHAIAEPALDADEQP